VRCWVCDALSRQWCWRRMLYYIACCACALYTFYVAQSDSTAGAGAMVSTVVEDAFYVCTLAARRAFATGNADCAAGVVNHVVTAVSDRLLPELEARLRLAFDDTGPGGAPSGGSMASNAGGGSGGHGLPPGQVERIASLRAALMSSTPVKLAAAKLSAYQAVDNSRSRGRPGLSVAEGVCWARRRCCWRGRGWYAHRGERTPINSSHGPPDRRGRCFRSRTQQPATRHRLRRTVAA
jgi:hypothetical protein